MKKEKLPTKTNQILEELDIIPKNTDHKNNVLTKLTEVPLKEKHIDMPKTTAPVENIYHQADLLFLPEDDGYKYLLVVVDLATHKTDFEPLQNKLSRTVATAINKIYSRRVTDGKYLSSTPKVLEVDDGSEFKGDFARVFKFKNVKIRNKVAGRHRQQATVESMNGIISRLVQRRMLAEEITHNETSRSWVDILPKLRQLINKHYAHEPRPMADGNTDIRCKKDTCNVLDVGTRVRVKLDNPKDLVTNKTLHGKFRVGDIRWENKIRTITRIFLRPNQPVMYQVDNNDNVAYTKLQLQVVGDDEVQPNMEGNRLMEVKQILKKLKKKNRVYYEILWSDDTTSEEPRTQLIKEIPDMIKDFEKR